MGLPDGRLNLGSGNDAAFGLAGPPVPNAQPRGPRATEPGAGKIAGGRLVRRKPTPAAVIAAEGGPAAALVAMEYRA